MRIGNLVLMAWMTAWLSPRGDGSWRLDPGLGAWCRRGVRSAVAAGGKIARPVARWRSRSPRPVRRGAPRPVAARAGASRVIAAFEQLPDHRAHAVQSRRRPVRRRRRDQRLSRDVPGQVWPRRRGPRNRLGPEPALCLACSSGTAAGAGPGRSIHWGAMASTPERPARGLAARSRWCRSPSSRDPHSRRASTSETSAPGQCKRHRACLGDGLVKQVAVRALVRARGRQG